MTVNDRAIAIATDMNAGPIEFQKMMCAADNALNVARLVFDEPVRMNVREVLGFTVVHGGLIRLQFRGIALLVPLEYFLAHRGFVVPRGAAAEPLSEALTTVYLAINTNAQASPHSRMRLKDM